MCGIAGFAGWRNDPARNDAQLRAMCAAIRHRGPDDEGRLVQPGVALGMRRLSIIDVAGGAQPIGNEDGSVQVVFNGEIYNHHELRARLEARGHRFATHCDTETLVHLYEDHGEHLVSELRGMFAFAIWDARRRRLVVGRDRLGIKPLYYWETADGVAFASELRSFLALSHFPARVNRTAVAHYLSLGYVPDPHCIFDGVRKLPPAHVMVWEPDHDVRVSRYWRAARDEIRCDEHEAVEELRALIQDCVGSHLESEVPLGAFLSGGLDSSTVVSEMARQVGHPVRTFTIGFAERAFNEAPHAASVARSLGTLHTELIVRPNVDVLVEEVIRGFDEPFADSSALPTYLVSKLAREHVTVALSGDGGDELFGGYSRYAEVLGRRELGPAAARRWLGAAARRVPHMAPGRNRLLDLARTRQGRFARTVATPLDPAEGGIARPELVREVGSIEALFERWFGPAAASRRDFATQMMLVDIDSYLPGDILTKVDRMSMAVSLEARVPLLDHRLVEFAAALPSDLKIRNGQGKWLLRRAIDGLVPRQVLTKRKQGFAVPLRHWLRSELRHRVDALLDRRSPIYEYVVPSAVGRIATEHRLGRRDHSGVLWTLLSLQLWLQFLDEGALARPSTHGSALASVVESARAV